MTCDGAGADRSAPAIRSACPSPCRTRLVWARDGETWIDIVARALGRAGRALLLQRQAADGYGSARSIARIHVLSLGSACSC